MSKPEFKNKELYFLLVPILLVFGLLAFKSKKIPDSIFDQTLTYNQFYPQLPERYQSVIGKKSIDDILNSDEAIVEKVKSLKHHAYIINYNTYRELIFVKKVIPNDTIQEPIRIDVYPSNRMHLDRKYLTYYKINSIRYSHNGSNYYVARQVLPNIEINKIVPYTQSWKTTILEVDNDILLKNETVQNIGGEISGKDSLLIGLDTATSPYDFLFAKAMQEKSLSYLTLDENLRIDDFITSSEPFKAYANNNELRLIRISDDLSFWKSLTQLNRVPELEFLNIDGIEIHKSLKSYVARNIGFDAIFDIKKIAAYYALLNLYSNRTKNDLYLRFNSNTKLLEPFYIHGNLGALNTYVKDLEIQHIEFLKEYRQQLSNLLISDDTKRLIHDNSLEIKKRLEQLHQADPNILFDEQIFSHNKFIIEKALNPSTSLKIALIAHKSKQLSVEVSNLSNFPIEIIELSHKQKKFIASPEKGNVILPDEKRNVIFELPDSYENLFVQKKKKTTGFIFDKHIFELAIGYRFTGTSDLKYNEITPFIDLDELAKTDDLLRSESDLSTFDFITVDEINKIIEIKSDTIILNKPIVFPAGYMVKGTSGLKIDIVSGGKIISKSPISLIGSDTNPIKIFSSDGKGQGLFIVSAKKISELKYVEFDNLTNQAHGLWDLTGAVVFYESPVNLDHVLIANNSCEDGLNIIRTNFTMNNTIFRNTQSDAFDGDFVQGTLTNCTFENLGNDAIDVSGSFLEMYDLKIIKAGDKALSAGEDSKMKAERITIDQCEIAVAGKDLSVVEINDVTILNSKLGFTAFQKKPEFGASNITATNVILKHVETAHLIENKSSLLLNGKQVETIDQVKEQMYGVEFGVDSKETRVKKLY